MVLLIQVQEYEYALILGFSGLSTPGCLLR